MSLNNDNLVGTYQKQTTFTLMGILLILSLFGSGCRAAATQEPSPTLVEEESISTPIEQESTQPPVEREPFSSRAESGDGIIVSWSGFTNGYLTGKDDSVEITLENQTDQPWKGGLCILLQSGQLPTVLNMLGEQDFNVDSGSGFSDTLSIQIPETVEAGAYGLTLVVHKPGNPLVNLVPIQIGDTETVRDPATQEDLDAALAACPPLITAEELINRAIDHLSQGESIPIEAIELVSVESYQFPDTSLGVPEPDTFYAQVLTPGYIIHLQVGEDTYIYHASEERVVLAEAQIAVVLYQTIEIPELGMSFEVPGSWQQLEDDLVWIPEPNSNLKLGFTWLVLQPPQEPEAAFLPSPAQTLSSTALDPTLGNGRRWTLEVYGPSPGAGTPSPVESVETHVIITIQQDQQRIGLHFYSSAPTAQKLSELESMLEHMLESQRFTS